MKSSLTARRVQPWKVNRGRKPDCGKKALILSTSPYMKTFSQGTSTLSKTKMVSFSSIRDESGKSNGLPITAACWVNEERQISLMPGASIGTVQMSANSFFVIGSP